MTAPAQKVLVKDARGPAPGIDWADYAISYDTMAKYNSYYAANVSLVANLVRRHAAKLPARICDLGAGTGNYLTALSLEGLATHSLHVDSSEEMNLRAIDKYANFGIDVDVVLGDVTDFADELPACDVYLCINCLYAISERDELTRRIRAAMPVESILVVLDFGRKMRFADWIPSLARTAFAVDGPGGVSKLLKSGIQIAKHNSSGAVGQAAGIYWLHSSKEFQDFFIGHGLEVLCSGVCYRGYCDYVVVRR